MGNRVVYFEIGCKDTKASADFYSKLFDWKLTPQGATMSIDPGEGFGIPGHIHSLGHEPHNYVTVYAEVDDLQAKLDRAKSLGGKTIVGPTEVPGMGHFAWLADPEGTIMGLWKPTKK